MAFIEHSTEVYDTTLDKITEFFISEFDLVQDDEDPAMFWCDNTKTIGIHAEAVSSTGMKLRVCTNSGETKYTLDGIIADSSNSSAYWQKSKNKDVKYVRGSFSSTKITDRLLFAKDNNGEWCIFADNYLYHKNGRMTLGGTNVTVATNTPFSAVQMPNLASSSGGKFTELYKMLTATLFGVAGTYVDFGGDPYRVVSVQCVSSSSTTLTPNYAFPVADET